MASRNHTVDEYLEALYFLAFPVGEYGPMVEGERPAPAARVAEMLGVSAPTASEMLKRMESDGLIERDGRRPLLTPEGRTRAENVVRHHRIIERFLTDVLGIPWDEVHEEAERLEHAMSPVLEERMMAAIGDATTCPHGHPIEVGQRHEGVPLADVEVGASVRVLRFENEAEDLLHYLKASGIEPGMTGTLAERTGEEIVVAADGGARVALTASVAETVSVAADPSPPARTALPEQLVIATDRYGR